MKILIVEDDPDVCSILETVLKREFFATDTATDGKSGSYKARVNEYDLVILDNLLPEKDGATVCREIRAAGKTLPILMLSAKSETETKVDLLDAGADDYLTKPFAFDELLARIRALLRRPECAGSDILEIGNLRLDTRQHLCMLAEKEIRLTRKEFILLSYLMRNTGTVLSRGTIIEHVWDMNADPPSNTVEAHIRSLRKKLDTDFEDGKFIRTVPGFGYVMVAE